jgi:transcriptional regulator with XRE-family HTH domain
MGSWEMAKEIRKKIRYDGVFANLLFRYLNKRQDIPQAELARRLGISDTAITRWLKNEQLPGRAPLVFEIAKIYDLTEVERNELLIAADHSDAIPLVSNSIPDSDDVSTTLSPLATTELTRIPIPPAHDPSLNITEVLGARLDDLKQDIKRLLREKGKENASGGISLNEGLATLEALPVESIPPLGTLPPGSRMPFSANPLFVGREPELKAIAVALKGGETVAIGQIAATTGLGGIGKTQLAVAFVHHYGQFFSGGVHWLSFADPNGIATEIAACGITMPELRADFDTFKLEEQVQLVLASWQSPLPRLLIFDNCEESSLVEQWRPKTGGSRVLITSRRQQWDAMLNVQAMVLETLTREQSIELLLKFRPDLAATDPVLEQIAAELGDLPLALHLAGNYLARYRHGIKPEQYLVQLRQPALLQHQSLQQGDLSPTGHEQHVARTFALSYERLNPNNQIDALALALLARAAWFAPGQLIPRSLLLASIELPTEEDGLPMLCSNCLISDWLRLTQMGVFSYTV